MELNNNVSTRGLIYGVFIMVSGLYIVHRYFGQEYPPLEFYFWLPSVMVYILFLRMDNVSFYVSN